MNNKQLAFLNKNKKYLVFMILLFILTGCSTTGLEQEQTGKLSVVATTSFVGEAVGKVAGDKVALTVLVQSGQNPHAYQLSPQDLVKVSQADVIFANGFGLEGFLDNLLEGASNPDALVIVSEGIVPLQITDHDHEHEEEDHDDHGEEAEENQLGLDPHVWFDPNNIMVWTENIADVLTEMDPDNQQTYRANATDYLSELEELDRWIQKQVASIPEENRKLVTDHTVFGYFAEEFGFKQVGAVIPAPTTEAETSGQQLARLQDVIQQEAVKAIFVSVDLNPTMAERVAQDTGINVVFLYFGSLTQGGPADSYTEFMRYNVQAIVEALR